MSNKKFPKAFLEKCRSITAKRPRTVIEHILKHGFITTQELKDIYGYNHPPRAARDVKEQGIPLEMYRVMGTDGRKIGAYKFGDPDKVLSSRFKGRTAFSKELRKKLIENKGPRCEIYLEEFPERELQIDHRIPFEIAGDSPKGENNPDDFMLLCGSANMAKSWSCEHCINRLKLKKPEICRNCYWAFPENYEHIALRNVRRIDIIWTGDEIEEFEQLKSKTEQLQKKMPAYVKEIIRKNLKK